MTEALKIEIYEHCVHGTLKLRRMQVIELNMMLLQKSVHVLCVITDTPLFIILN